MDIVRINMANHEARGEWCECGETAKECYYLALIGPASQKWREEQYALLFAPIIEEV